MQPIIMIVCMTRHEAAAWIRTLASEERLALTAHAKRRQPERGKQPLTRAQIANCLIKGVITEGPAPDIREPNGWKVTVTRFLEGEKHKVAAVLVVDERVVVITAYGWSSGNFRRGRRGENG